MLLGKRPRPSMRRTTSMTQFSRDEVGALDKIHKNGAPTDVSKSFDACSSTMTAAVSPAAASVSPPSAGATAWGGAPRPQLHQHQLRPAAGFEEEWERRFVGAMVSPVGRSVPRRNSADFAVEAAHFLRFCGLCKRRLAPGKDIFMYRGEIAFCSSECRQQQMAQDKRKDKCSVTSMKQDTTPTTAAAAPESSGSGGETVAAA